MKYHAAFVALSVCLGAVSAVSAAVPQVVAEFKQLCIDTRADPAKALPIADAAGWGPPPEDNQALVDLAKVSDVRVSDAPSFHFLTISADAGAVPAKTCEIYAHVGFDEATAGMREALSAEPDERSATAWTWSLVELDGVVRPSGAENNNAYFRATHRGPNLRIKLSPLEGNGTLLQYSETGLGQTVDEPPPIAASAGDVEHFKAWIEQDGRRFPFRGEVHLRRRPFSIVFQGSELLGYSVVSDVDERALAAKSTPAELDGIFDPLGVGAEEREGGTSLFVNGPADHPLTTQFWIQEKSPDGMHRFQSFKVGANGVATATRRIEQIQFPAAGDPVPVARFNGHRLHMLLTGSPPVKAQPYTDPKYATIVFD